MKEEGTPIRSSFAASDEIFSTLLKINNFDNSIKDDSLDINLSACVTISTDATSICNNSLSSDFWKVLDENAQAEESSSATTNRSNLFEDIVFISPLPPPPPPPPSSSSQQHLPPANSAPDGRIDSVAGLPKKKYRSRKQQLKETSKTTSRTGTGDEFKCATVITSDKEDIAISNISFKGNFPSAGKSDGTTLTDGYKFKCEHCRVILDGLEEFNKHEASHKVSFKCIECDREFVNQSGLKKHLKSHRDESRKDGWKKCPDCGKCLKLGSMWMHRKIHSDNKKYGCDICGQKFVQKINLTHHSRIHTSEKPFECPECQKRFQERSHLQRHQKYHAQTRPFRCEKCGKMYKTERCLKVHNLVHLEKRPFACQVCNKSFISNSKLKQHSNIHTGERPFKCNYCTRDFTNFPNWLKHTRRRHKVDHKTGELLEHIPSYCTKSAKKSTPVAENANAEKKPAKRKKKVIAAQKDQAANSTETSEPKALPVVPVDLSRPSNDLILKTKVKQEVEKDPVDLSPRGDFTDFHCLSITSAEELIMEQALEMEECGYYEPPYASEGMQFFKNEFLVKKEFENKAMCSVDSSPFSSPASIELPITYNLQSLPSSTVASASATRPIEPALSSRVYMTNFNNQTLPSVDTLLNACYFKSENQNM